MNNDNEGKSCYIWSGRSPSFTKWHLSSHGIVTQIKQDEYFPYHYTCFGQAHACTPPLRPDWTKCGQRLLATNQWERRLERSGFFSTSRENPASSQSTHAK